MERPLIKINSDDAERIARLYDIGTELAERVVQYRNQNGNFKNPSDLAKVKGVSSFLAETLSPHIDWSVPDEIPQEYPIEGVNVFTVITSIAFLAIAFWVLYRAWKNFDFIDWIDVWFYCSEIWADIFLLLFVCFYLIPTSFVKNLQFHKKLKSISAFFLFLGLLGVLSLGAANIFYYQFKSSWDALIANNNAFWTMWVLIASSHFFLLLLSANIRPLLVSNRIFTLYTDISLLIMAITALIGTWYFEDDSFLYQLVLVFLAIICIGMGLAGIRSNKSAVTYFVDHSLISSKERQKEQEIWLKWLNTRLPNPEDQKSLQSELNQIYPPSKFRTFISVTIIGIGGWIVLQSIGAIIQWVVGKGLDKIFK